ncbi:MAG: hypothetical protein QOJ17_5444 [Rhodospirillaceae bacterium]|nr:hypothetical protein [Rhodospirillaceae bacterium]
MDVGAVDEREGALLPGERQEQVGAAQHDRLGAALAAQVPADVEERAALLVGDTAHGRHLAIGGVDLLERVALGRHDLGRGDPAIEPTLHHGARAHDADFPELAARDGGVDFRNGVEDRQGRDRQKFLDAEMAAHGGDGGGLGTGRLHPLHQPREDVGLSAGILVGKVAAHFLHVGVGDRKLQRNAGGCVPLDQAAIVEVGCGRADAADESDMHGSDCRLSPPGRQRMCHAPQADARTSRNDTRRRCVSSHSTRRTQRKLCSSVSRPTSRSSGWSRSTRGSR